jgi:hypothetical protein
MHKMVILLLLISCAFSAEISGEILPSAPSRPASIKGIKLLLDGGKQITYTNSEGEFKFLNVQSGIHHLEIFDSTFSYKPMLIEIQDDEISVYDGTPSAMRSEKLPYPLKISQAKPIQYFEIPEPFSITKILFNPMILTAVVVLGLTLCKPNMQLDPEQMKEFKEMQKQMNSGWMSSFLQPPS